MDKNFSPLRLELLITIVDKGKGTFYADFIQSYDANLQWAVVGQGTAAASLLEYLGLNDSRRSVVFSIVRENQLDELMPALEEKFRTFKGGKGISIAVPLSSVIGTTIFGFLCNEKRAIKEEEETT